MKLNLKHFLAKRKITFADWLVQNNIQDVETYQKVLNSESLEIDNEEFLKELLSSIAKSNRFVAAKEDVVKTELVSQSSEEEIPATIVETEVVDAPKTKKKTKEKDKSEKLDNEEE